MFVKVHKTYRDIVAVCDSNLIGKNFEEGKFMLDIKENFYKGDEMDKKEIIEFMEDMAKEDATFNIVGEESVECAVKAKLTSEEGIKKIAGIPFVLVLL